MLEIYLVSMLIGLIGSICYVAKLKIDLRKGAYVDKNGECTNMGFLFAFSLVPLLNTLYAILVAVVLVRYLFLYVLTKLILKW